MKKNHPLLSAYDVIIVNYNGAPIIRQCLDSIYSSSALPGKVIIYDNNSTDDSLKIIRRYFPKVTLIAGEKNLGFGRANNAAMKLSKTELILFMNNDVLLDKSCSETLLKGFRDHNLAILNPLIIKGWEKKSNQAIYAFGAEMNRAGFNYGLYDNNGGNRQNLSSFSAACVMIRRQLIPPPLFEPRFFMYYEEPEISAKILKNNFRIGRIKEAKCYHLESYSSPQKSTDGIAFRQFHGVQNRWFIIGKHWPLHLLLPAILINVAHLLYMVYFYLRNRKFAYLSLIYRAPVNLLNGIRSRPNQPIKNRYWHRTLPGTPLSTYLSLRKRVFH